MHTSLVISEILLGKEMTKANLFDTIKAHLVGKGFTQISGVHYDETYSPIMDNITF